MIRGANRRGPHLLHTAALSGPAALPANGAVAALLAGSSCGYAIQPAPRDHGWLAPQARAAPPAARCFAPWPECARRAARARPAPRAKRLRAGFPGVSQDPHVLDTVFLGALRMERPFRIPRAPARHDCHTPATVVLPRRRRPPQGAQAYGSSRRLKVPTYPHIHRPGHPPPPHPHPPLPPPALSGYLDESSASSRVDLSMRHLGWRSARTAGQRRSARQ